MRKDIPLFQIARCWRLAQDKLQWVVQRRQGNEWRGVTFHMQRDSLLRTIGEQVRPEPDEPAGLVEIALDRVRRFPAFHPNGTLHVEPDEASAVEREAA